MNVVVFRSISVHSGEDLQECRHVFLLAIEKACPTVFTGSRTSLQQHIALFWRRLTLHRAPFYTDTHINTARMASPEMEQMERKKTTNRKLQYAGVWRLLDISLPSFVRACPRATDSTFQEKYWENTSGRCGSTVPRVGFAEASFIDEWRQSAEILRIPIDSTEFSFLFFSFFFLNEHSRGLLDRFYVYVFSFALYGSMVVERARKIGHRVSWLYADMYWYSAFMV